MKTYKKMIQIFTQDECRKGSFLVVLMLFSMFFEIIGVSLVLPVITLMTEPDLILRFPLIKSLIEWFGNPKQAHLILGSVFCLVAFYFMKTAYMMYATWKQNKFAYDVQSNLSQRLFKCYLYQPWIFYLKHNSARLILNITSEPSVFVTNIVRPSMLLLTEGLVLSGILVFLLFMQPIATLVVSTSVICFTGIYYGVIRKYILSWGITRQRHERQRLQHVQQGLGGVKDAKLLGREKAFLSEHDVHSRLVAAVNKRIQTFIEVPRLGLELFAVIGLSMMVLDMIVSGELLSTFVPTLGVFMAATFRLMPSVNRIVGAIQSVRYGLPVLTALHEEIQQLEKGVVDNDSNSTLRFQHEIVLTDVGYCYEGTEKYALCQINLNILRGTSVGFIGESGAGKSTLIDAVLGLLSPTEGCIRVDGVDIQSNLRGWQSRVGYVSQMIFLSDDTLRRNIAFGVPEALIDDKAVWQAVHSAQLGQFVKGLLDGLETFVGERGVRLSGGQRQRIGIARALYHNPEVLVLDEATSALDMHTESEVMQAVNALHGEKTLIIIAHRFSTVEKCDYLYRMEHGHIVDEGEFEQVVSRYHQNDKETMVAIHRD